MFDLNDQPTFYSHCKNNNMDLKLWEKKENSFKELLNIPIRLHPFYDTFSNQKLSNQFYKEQVKLLLIAFQRNDNRTRLRYLDAHIFIY